MEGFRISVRIDQSQLLPGNTAFETQAMVTKLHETLIKFTSDITSDKNSSEHVAKLKCSLANLEEHCSAQQKYTAEISQERALLHELNTPMKDRLLQLETENRTTNNVEKAGGAIVENMRVAALLNGNAELHRKLTEGLNAEQVQISIAEGLRREVAELQVSSDHDVYVRSITVT